MTPIDLSGRIFLVAGAGGDGIGTACAVALAKAGATVIGLDRSPEGVDSAQRALAEAGGDHRAIHIDCSDMDAMTSLVAQIEREHGPVRGAINVAGGMQSAERFRSLLDLDAGRIFDEIIALNLKPPLVTSIVIARAVAAHGQGGAIVQIGSNAGLQSMPFGAGYGAAKAGLMNLTRTMAVEWGRYGLRVNCLSVGMIRTAKSHYVVKTVDPKDEAAIPLKRIGRSEDIAGAALFLCSDLAGYVTGATLNVDGGGSAKASGLDEDNLPSFINDPAVRARLLGP
jgi:NAD(P)-dependent dehydrogenase (short-subunit alcohol dehydrogenase family)